ncbi:MAG: cation acetate symporter [Betaproteobacteria bacterium]|nr:cation acetate symporter [Betaproteobacteria bacterium]MDH5352215.1 cation acetate symporter [Betaproteobacteria bacterium]
MSIFRMQGSFIENLPKIYGFYTGGFVVFVLLMALMERAGVKEDTIGLMFVGFTVFIYAVIGWLSRTMQLDAYYVAGRQVPAVFNGMATAADWMSGASFVAMAGGIYMAGHPYLAFVVGWTGGYVLVAVLMAPYLRKFGCYTVPDFIGTRYGGNLARLCAVIVLVVASFTYVTAQINATGTIASRALLIPFQVGIWIGLAGILLCSMLGGMRAVTWTQVAQYIVLIIAYLVPVIWMSNKQGFGVIPQLVYGDAVLRIAELETLHQVGVLKSAAQSGLTALNVKHNAPPDTFVGSVQFVTLVACMMMGTASLPHILMRYFTTPSVRAARTSVAWSLFFIFLLYFTAPALATFTKLQMLDPNLATSIIGKSVADVNAITWVQKWTSVGQVKVIDLNGDGILQINEFFMRPDIVVLATPEIAGLPYVISGLVAAGGMAAAMSTADGLLLAIANALSHDLYYKMIDPKADVKRRLIVARVLLIVIGAAGAGVASMRLTGILGAVAWAFDFAMSGLFFPLVLGVWWKRANRPGAIAGMVVGLLVGSWYLYMVYAGGMKPWIGIDHLRFGIIGAGASLIAMVVVTLVTAPPDKETQDMVDEVRIPKGDTVLGSTH